MDHPMKAHQSATADHHQGDDETASHVLRIRNVVKTTMVHLMFRWL